MSGRRTAVTIGGGTAMAEGERPEKERYRYEKLLGRGGTGEDCAIEVVVTP